MRAERTAREPQGTPQFDTIALQSSAPLLAAIHLLLARGDQRGNRWRKRCYVARWIESHFITKPALDRSNVLGDESSVYQFAVWFLLSI